MDSAVMNFRTFTAGGAAAFLLLFAPGTLLSGADTDAADQVAAIRAINDIYARLDASFSVEWAKERVPIDRFIVAHPDNPEGLNMVKNYMYAFESANPMGDSEKEWASFEKSPDPTVAAVAKEKNSFFVLAKAPLELSFKGLDGEPVDMAQLRGKIVLLDFWATWCPPCMEELPNVRRLYEKFHAKGFEIVGISCDVSPDQAKGNVQKWMKTGPQVLEFTESHHMPWPQDYEGKKHNEGGNSLAKRFAVTGIPAAFLIGRDGRIQAMNLRGDRMEKAIADALAH